jgi:hypothetical protein
MTLTEVKALLNVSTTTLDAYWEDLIPELEGFAREYTHDDNLAEKYGFRFFVAKACEWMGKSVGLGVESETLGDYSVTYAKGRIRKGEFPPDVLAWLDKDRRPRWA